MVKKLRIGLDVDGVLSCFSSGVIKRAKLLGLEKEFPATCREVDCWDMSETFSKVMKEAWKDDEFWLNLPVLEGASPLPFIPTVYITSRQVPSLVTKKWLDRNGFPDAPVITVSHPSEKLAHIKALNLDLYVDDLYSTVRELRENGINSFLFRQPYQRGHIKECEGLPIIDNLNEVLDILNETV
jgi:uncharacterized HAD superfamily protein